MISRFKNEFQKRREDNKGAAIVMAIVAIAFIGMLVAMVIYMAYCNYLMKTSDVRAKNNFYSAEYALEVINAGIQHDISECMSAAYVDTMKNSSDQTEEYLSSVFNTAYITETTKKLKDSGANKWNKDHLLEMWTNAGITKTTVEGGQGAFLADAPDGSYTVSTENGYITLSGLRIVYGDERGFISIIETDIRVKVPDIVFAKSSAGLKIENFSIIANDSLINAVDNSYNVPTATVGSKVKISGSVFGGYEGIHAGDDMSTEFVVDPTDNLTLGDDAYTLIADSINVENMVGTGARLLTDETFSTYVQNINLQTANLSLAGKNYVGDDMDIAGHDSSVTLSGIYRGYGNNYSDAEGSSSILINGANTDLDFSNLEELILSGHAYVGAKKYDANVDRLAYAMGKTVADVTGDKITEDADYDRLKDGTYTATNTTPENDADLLMGESVSVKPNQMLYLVPGECIGYEVETGNQVISKNPMTYAEYSMLLNETTEEIEIDENGVQITDPQTGEYKRKKKYEPVRLSVLWDKLGGMSYTSKYKAVYRRVNGTVLVYIYLDFDGSEEMANDFFEAYYNYDKAGVQSYVNSYINSLEWGEDLNGDNLTLAGNAFKLGTGKQVEFLENSLDAPQKRKNMIEMQETYTNVHESLMHTLSPEYQSMTTAQLSSEIFDTLVDATKLTEFDGKEFKDAADTMRACISKDDVVYPSAACPQDKTKVIISSEDVYVTKDFKGLIIAGGNVYVCAGCNNINYDPKAVRQAMNTFWSDASGQIHYAYDVLGESGRLSYGVMTDNGQQESIDLQDLITYQNWKKE